MPFGFHLTMDTLPSGDLLLRPTTLLNAVSWIWRPSFERQRDFNPPEQRAAQRTLPASPTSTVASVSLRLVHSVDILGLFGQTKTAVDLPGAMTLPFLSMPCS